MPLERQLDQLALDMGIPEQQFEAARILEQAGWVDGSASVLDIGGGHGLFPALVAARGARVVVADSFADVDDVKRQQVAEHYASLGVETQFVDAVREALPFEDSTFEAATSFDAMEHFHHSPRGLFDEIRRVAKPGAKFVLGVPNAVNVRKRVAVPLGRSNWAHFEDWWCPEVFHGHVREPTVADLKRIGEYLELSDARIVGRNWLGYRGGVAKRVITRLADYPLRTRPSMCANLYLIGSLPDD
jgi:SAM-dependent methyltransferase